MWDWGHKNQFYTPPPPFYFKTKYKINLENYCTFDGAFMNAPEKGV